MRARSEVSTAFCHGQPDIASVQLPRHSHHFAGSPPRFCAEPQMNGLFKAASAGET
ncbi:hypothetical protein ACFOHY_03120 [Rhizobium rosettiformans]|uniref:hypothetical protein n=1 Tax=Rhizobium rosettiformans TaxID=1368430 RepID=UPI00360A070A